MNYKYRCNKCGGQHPTKNHTIVKDIIEQLETNAEEEILVNIENYFKILKEDLNVI